MPVGSTSLNPPMVVRQDTAPPRPIDGMLWINPTGGANGNNSERYIYNGSTDSWELTNAVGPDSPNYTANGALWRDTGNGVQKVYDEGWNTIGMNHTGAYGYLSADQTISSATYTQVQFDATNYDPDGAFDTANHEYVAPSDGKYVIILNTRWSQFTTGNISINRIRVNTTDYAYSRRQVDNGYGSMNTISTVDLVSGDSVIAQVYHSTGNDETLDGRSEWTYLSVHKVA